MKSVPLQKMYLYKKGTFQIFLNQNKLFIATVCELSEVSLSS